MVPRYRSSPEEDYTGSSRSIKKSDTFAIHPQHVAMETTQGCAASICKQDGKTKKQEDEAENTQIYFLIVMVLWMLCKDGLNTDRSFRCLCCLCVCASGEEGGGSCACGIVRTLRLVLVVLYNFSIGFKVMFSA